MGKEEENGKTIVVGVRMDQQSKELLTWALVKIAHPNDRVVALHVLPSSSNYASDGNSIDKDLESMLTAYEGFCNLKQIDLKLKVCKSSSLRRVLVREANSFAASQLILGVAKSNHTIGPSPISVAKYCAKKLPKTCSVLAVSNGKIVFEREANDNKERSSLNSSESSPHHNPLLVQTALDQNCSVCDSPIRSKNEVLSPATSSISVQNKNLHGWPVVRKSVLTEEKPKGLVMQWAMRLPTRYSTSSVAHSSRKPSKLKSNFRKSTLNGEQDSQKEEKKPSKELEMLQEKYASVCRLFSYKELMDATSNFSHDKLIGKGGNSLVYKGSMADGKQLAVKILKPTEDSMKEFVSEIEIITTLSHKNIVSLIGFCCENDHLVLVYNYLSRGSLEENLHGDKEDNKLMSWVERYKVAVGIAEALNYLHSGSDNQPVIHKDVKSSNILLSQDFDPQLSDFGLATWVTDSQSVITCSDVAGTFGYLAPEYFMYGRVDEKIDVYAFGVVLLELISGKKPISADGPHGQKSLVMWAKPILHGSKTKELVDQCLSNEYDSDQLERMILAATLCIRRNARSRPQISLVLKLLQGEEETIKWAKLKACISEEKDDMEDNENDNVEVTQHNVNLRSHLNLALLDIEDDSTSVSSTEQTLDPISSNTSLDDYFQGRWSRSSSFD